MFHINSFLYRKQCRWFWFCLCWYYKVASVLVFLASVKSVLPARMSSSFVLFNWNFQHTVQVGIGMQAGRQALTVVPHAHKHATHGTKKLDAELQWPLWRDLSCWGRFLSQYFLPLWILWLKLGEYLLKFIQNFSMHIPVVSVILGDVSIFICLHFVCFHLFSQITAYWALLEPFDVIPDLLLYTGGESLLQQPTLQVAVFKVDLSHLPAQAAEMKHANCIWIWKSTVHGLACTNQFHNRAGGKNRPHCWYENTYTYTHAHAYTTNTLSLSIIPVFPGADMELYHPFTGVVFTPASLKPSPRLRHWFPSADRCEHMLTHGEAMELHHSFLSIHHVSVYSTWNSALLLHGSVQHKSGTKGGEKRAAHGSGMLCAITANDMPPCKLWP